MTSHIQLFLLALVASTTLGAKIKMYATPGEVSPPITFQLSISCYLEEDTQPVSPSRRRRSIKETDDRMVSVSSIIVTRNGGEKVARINHFNPAEVLASDANLNVVGDLSAVNNIDGFITLYWDSPNKDEIGAYSCEIEAQNEDGKDVTFSDTLSVAYREPDLDILMKEFVLMHNQIFNRPQAFAQTGVIACGDSKNWKVGPYDSKKANSRFFTVKETFKYPFYPRPPVFTVALKRVENDGGPIRVDANVREVTPTGFEVECVTWGGAAVKDVEFVWTAQTSTPPYRKS